MSTSELRKLPGVDKILAHPDIKKCVKRYGHTPVVYTVRQIIKDLRDKIIQNAADTPSLTVDGIANQAVSQVSVLVEPSLKHVINATGVILHTNLGRAPLGEGIINDIASDIERYSNLEFDLTTGRRGQRNFHIVDMMKCITGAEDAIVVNNNAAAIILVLNTLAKGKEAIVSRGELIEIGGAFRLPEIMAASGAIMREVGTTNRTRLSDYEQAIGPDTGLIFKAHKSNYNMSGFTEEVSVETLAECSKSHGICMIYDIGSGLLQRPDNPLLKNEPDVQGALASGADIVTFSCDKLLGGPQAGVIVGKTDIVQKCAKAPLMRAFRVGKLTISALSSVCRHYFSDQALEKEIPVFTMIKQSLETIEKRAMQLCEAVNQACEDTYITAEVVGSRAQVGGGSLPDLFLDSKAVALVPSKMSAKNREKFAEDIFHRLLERTPPVIAILREGRILLDLSAVSDEEVSTLAAAVVTCLKERAG